MARRGLPYSTTPTSRWTATSSVCVVSVAACGGTVRAGSSGLAVVVAMFRAFGFTRCQGESRQLARITQQVASNPVASLGVAGQGLGHGAAADHLPHLRRTFLRQRPQIVALCYAARPARSSGVARRELAPAVAGLPVKCAIQPIHRSISRRLIGR